ncbi:MAG: ABC transporter ATP-binding protein [Clostridia bacterium]|nr:ABC transporter ATP-binding protein [Clostridia bacterium]
MLEIKNVTKRFGNYTAVEDLSLTVRKGSVYGLVGYNGAGKTTLLKTVAGIYRADGGKVLMNGEDIFDNAKQKQHLFFVPDELHFEPYTTLNKTAKFYQSYYPDFNNETFVKLTDLLGLDRKAKVSSFSKGMQRQAEMAIALACNPQVLLLDESFDGLDPAKRNLMKNMLLEYAAEKEASIIISSHNLHELGDMCDHIGLINGKKIVLDASVDDLSGTRCKLRAVFSENKVESDFAHINYKKVEIDGKIVVLTINKAPDVAEDLLRKMNPLLVERFVMSVEEIFLDEMEEGDYDFKSIFG